MTAVNDVYRNVVMNLDEGQIVHFQFSFHVLISHTLFDDGGDAVLPVHWTELPTSPKTSFLLRKLGTFALFELPALLWGNYLLKWRVIYLKYMRGFNRTLSINMRHLSLTSAGRGLNFYILKPWYLRKIFNLQPGGQSVILLVLRTEP